MGARYSTGKSLSGDGFLDVYGQREHKRNQP
jgi:hypothetical protein